MGSRLKDKILALLCEGYTDREIADRLGLKVEQTVGAQRRRFGLPPVIRLASVSDCVCGERCVPRRSQSVRFCSRRCLSLFHAALVEYGGSELTARRMLTWYRLRRAVLRTEPFPKFRCEQCGCPFDGWRSQFERRYCSRRCVYAAADRRRPQYRRVRNWYRDSMEIADELGCSPATVERYRLKHCVRMRSLKQIAIQLGCSVEAVGALAAAFHSTSIGGIDESMGSR
jgi:DNA-binding CsgD family transcriptional regulator